MSPEVDVLIVGGGVVGCAIAYHLARAGITDTVLLERSELTSGSTWHAAGGTGAFLGGGNETWLHRYSFELYPELEADTGQSCGLHHVGMLLLARTEARVEELRRHDALARRHGLEPRWLEPEQAVEHAPVLDPASIRAALWEPSAAHVDPSGVTQAFARGARDRGVEIVRDCPVIATERLDGAWRASTATGVIRARRIVNAAGLWAREVAGQAGLCLPLMPVEHHYFVTESIPEVAALERELPLVTDADAEYYMRQERDGLLLGVYEDECTHWAEAGTPPDFGHELLPDHLERIERNLEQAIASVPPLGSAGIKRVFNGPMIFSPDLNPLVGPHPAADDYWCACGVMAGFAQGAAIGRVLADWMAAGVPPLDIFGWDVARFGTRALGEYTKARTANMYSTRFKTVYPYEERPAGRPAACRPAFAFQCDRGAVFGESDGWEVPLWFAGPGVAGETLTFRRPNWFEPVGRECRRVHDGVGIIDISAFAKHQVLGPGAADWLNRLLANRLPRRDGGIVLAPMLSPDGRLLGDFTVTRLAADDYLLLGSGPVDRFHHRWWSQWLPADGVTVASRTDALCGVSICGPRSRDLLGRLADADLSSSAMPYARALRCRIGPVDDVILLRLSYTGELGFELHFPPAAQLPLLQELLRAGEDLGADLVGIRALNSLRIEKGFGAWGLELSPDYTAREAGLDTFVKPDKGDFVGREAFDAQRERPRRYTFAQFEVDAHGADAWGGEPILTADEVIGFVTSGSYGHRTGRSLALGYLHGDVAAVPADLCVDILGERCALRHLQQSAFDPGGERMRA